MAETDNAVLDPRFSVIDLHTHPTLKSVMFKTKFWRGHNPPAYWFPLAMRVDLDAMLAGGVKAFLCTVYVVERPMVRDVHPLNLLSKLHPRARHIATAPMDVLCREYLDEAERMVETTCAERGDVIEIARGYSDIERIAGEGKLCMLHAVEGAHHLNGNIGMVDELYERGVCQMIVPHLYPNEAGGCVDLFSEAKKGQSHVSLFHPKYQDDSGMTEWGRELLDKLLDVGILVDPTHGTREFRAQTIEIARKHRKKRPVIMSHVCVTEEVLSELAPLPEDVREIAETGGVIGLMMTDMWPLRKHSASGVDFVLDSIDRLIDQGGEDVVAIGSDFDGFTSVPKDLKSPRGYRTLREAMLKKYTEDQVHKFLQGNAQRVLKDGWGKG